MAIITKYINETININDLSYTILRNNFKKLETLHINDIPYVGIKTRVYKNENIEINENINNIINHIPTAYPYFNKKNICKLVPTPSLSCYITQATGFTQTIVFNKNKRPIQQLTGVTPTQLYYTSKIKPKNLCIDKPFKYINTIHTSTIKFEFNLGLISRPIKIPVTLTSTYDEDLTLTNITSDFDLGIEVENINVGYILPAHNTLSFSFKIIMEGKDVIDNNYLYFHFNNGLIIRWRWCFRRQLSIMYYMFPNKKSYTEKFYYFSKTFRALGGREDVIPFVNIPKKAFSASYSFLPISIKNYLLNLSYKNEYDENLYPIWSEFTIPTSTQTDTNILYVEKISEFITEGCLIALIDKYNEEDYSIMQVINIISSENKLELNNKVDYYQDRTLVVPLIDVIISSDTNLRYYNVKDTNITLNVRTLK